LFNIRHLINISEPEYRVAIHQAWQQCDGTQEDFEHELRQMQWDNPSLPVDDLCANI
jgi:hypothetical protein